MDDSKFCITYPLSIFTFIAIERHFSIHVTGTYLMQGQIYLAHLSLSRKNGKTVLSHVFRVEKVMSQKSTLRHVCTRP